MTDTVEAPEEPGPVLSVTRWPTNAEMVADMARLGYLRPDWRTLDPTFGRGIWWKAWRPDDLVAHDLDPAKSPTGEPVDFRAMPYPDATFDVVVFDPPYVSVGSRTKTSIGDMHDRFGLTDAPTSPEGVQQLICDGLTECARVVKPSWRENGERVGGYLLAKCMNYVSGGRLRPGVHDTFHHATETLGLRYVDEFVHLGDPGPQPKENLDGTPRRQVHGRACSSTLLVFQRTRPPSLFD